MHFSPRTLLAAALCLAFASGASAQGFGNAPTFDKPQYFANETATLAITGMGTCKNIVIDWGDGVKDTVPSFDFGAVSGQNKLTATHKYANAQPFYVTVKNGPGPTLAEQCGSRSASTTVVWPGKLSKVSAAPSPATVGKPVDLVVEGAGVCPAAAVIRVTPAAGGAAQPVGGTFAGNAPWPRKVTYTPSAAGSFIIGHAVAPGQNVAASAGCFSMPAGSNGVFEVVAAAAVAPGNVPVPGGTVVSVDGRPVAAPAQGGSSPIDHTGGLEIMKPGSAPPCTPALTTFPKTTLSPGDKLTMYGCFGLQMGAVNLKAANGSLTKLAVDSWNEGTIVATVPADLSGLADQAMGAEVTTAKNQKLAKDGLSFVAARQTMTVPLSQFDIKNTSHGVVMSQVVGPNQAFQNGVCQTSVCAIHKVAPAPTPPFGGDDLFHITLKNGWVYKSHNLTSENSGADVNLLNCPVPSQVGPKPKLTQESTGNPLTFQVKNVWSGCLSWTFYRLDVVVTGPRGVPFK